MADLIERDAAYDAIGFWRCDRSCTDCPTKCTWFFKVKNIPAVNRWIPCSERLPESFIYVLCAGRDGIGILRYIGSKWLDDEAHVYTTNEITHWMSLPEPPEQEVSEDAGHS